MSYVSTPPTTPSTDVVRAFQKMRKGVLYVLIAWVFLGVGLTIMVGGLFVTVMRAAVGGGALIAALSGLILGLALVVVGAIIALVGFYADFIPGAGDLARVNPDFSTVSSLIRIGYIWGLILCLVGAILTIVIIGVLILLIGYVFLLIGFIGIMIMCFKLNEIYGNVMYLIAGIFFILSIFIPFLGIVSWVLLYVALGETIRKSQTSAGPTQPLIQV
jgi:hypothetical protein